MAFTPFIHTDIIFITQIIVTPVLGKSHQANVSQIENKAWRQTSEEKTNS